MVVRFGGCIIWLNIGWWYGVFQYIRSVRVEDVVPSTNICNDLMYRSLERTNMNSKK